MVFDQLTKVIELNRHHGVARDKKRVDTGIVRGAEEGTHHTGTFNGLSPSILELCFCGSIRLLVELFPHRHHLPYKRISSTCTHTEKEAVFKISTYQ
jgi:hypothetical protein